MFIYKVLVDRLTMCIDGLQPRMDLLKSGFQHSQSYLLNKYVSQTREYKLTSRAWYLLCSPLFLPPFSFVGQAAKLGKRLW